MPRHCSQVQGRSPCMLCGERACYVAGEHGRRGEPLCTVVCAGCGLGRVDPLPGEAELESWYRSGYRIDYKGLTQPTPRHLWRGATIARLRAERLIPLLQPGCTVVDIGCGAGELVYLLGATGFAARGFDPDSHYIRWEQETLGLTVERSRVEDLRIAPQSLDAATMYHVLEHMRDPVATLLAIRGWLKPNTLLVVEVPNFESTVQAPGHQFHRAHIHHFNQWTLNVAASLAGFRLEHAEIRDRGENLYGVLRNGGQALDPVNPSNAARVLSILRSHRRTRHYLTPHPYRRVWERLSRTISEFINARGRNERAILDFHAAQLRQMLGRKASEAAPAGKG